MNDKLQNEPEPAEFLLYRTEEGQARQELFRRTAGTHQGRHGGL